MEHTGKTEKKRRGAFTLAEFLVVVAITMILAGVSFVAVIRYQSRLKRLEMDQTAKEIFLAAQNRLSLDAPEGALKRILSQEPDSEEKLGIRCQGEDRDGVYVVMYQPHGDNRTEEIRNRLLPFGAVDETVRTDGSYLIFYEPEAGTVREVWYSDRYVFVEDDIGSTAFAEALADAGKREHFLGANPELADQGYAVGYYSGDSMTEPDVSPSDKPKKADLELVNDDMLYAKVTVPDMISGSRNDLKLYLEGVSSGAKGCMDLKNTRSSRVKKIMTDNAYYVILDDVTTDGMQFYHLNTDGAFQIGSTKLVPGEDIRMWLETSSSQSAVPAVSQVRQENSIFQGKKTDKVTIGSMRHLENLDYRISGFHPVADKRILELSEKEDINGNPAFEAGQQKNLDWPSFRNNMARLHSLLGNGTVSADRIFVCYSKTEGEREVTAATAEGCYAPVQPQFPLIYSGNAFDVTGILVRTSSGEDGGMFGTVTQNLSVQNLELKQANITSERNAGALIGMGDGSENTEGLKIQVEHVKIRYPQVLAKGSQGLTDIGKNDAGAVIGSFTGENLTIRNVMAADTYRETMTGKEDTAEKDNLTSAQETLYRIQSANGMAGGLVGMSSGAVSLYSSMASLYVDAMSYAGGLIGIVQAPWNASVSPNVVIESCYAGGHTVNGAFQTDLIPGQEGFDQTEERYNIVSRGVMAGGLAAVLPEGSQIAHTYVTASVYAPVYGEIDKEDDSISAGTGSEIANDSVRDTGDENGTAGEQTEKEVPDDQKQAAFVALFGSLYKEGTDTVPGAAASDSRFRYCYSAVKVNGTRVTEYPEGLKEDFEPKPEFALQAFPYDKTLGSGKAYPMPTVFQLVKKDSAGNGAQKALSSIVCVHIGDWLVPVEKAAPEPQEDGLKLHNGNRLWADYVMDMPENEETQYLTFSIKGEETPTVIYYVVAVNCKDLSATQYVAVSDAGKVAPGKWNENGSKNLKNPSRRIECTQEDGKLKVRLYLDNLSVTSAAYQALPDLNNPGNLSILKAGENIRIRVCEELRVPNDSDKFVDGNSLFAGIKPNGDGTYTAYIANIRHLENLNFFKGDGPENKIAVTKAVQTDNILWQEDVTVPSKTEAYCKEIAEAYPDEDVSIYRSRSQAAPAESFYPIENEELQSYDGGGYIISKLQVKSIGGKGSALFQKNAHLEIRNLNLKDPVMETSQNAAGIIVEAVGDSYASDWEESHLYLNNVHVYGDDMRIRAGATAGGIAAYISVSKCRMENVSFYGKNALVGSANGTGDIGGLAGNLRADDELQIKNCMFSGYVSGKNMKNNAGGLIGYLDVSQKKHEAGDTGVVLENCYVAGRNAPYPYPEYLVDDEQIQNGNNITGAYHAGGLIGAGKGALRISHCFSMANVYGYAKSYRSSVGGLIGKYEESAKLQLDSCYTGGLVSRSAGPDSEPEAGIIIGRPDVSWTSGYIPVLQLGTVTRCGYIAWDKLSGVNVTGLAKTAKLDGVTAYVPGQENMSEIYPSSDEEKADQTYSYDSSLSAVYPYKIWTTEPDEAGNLRKIYRGDWIQ